MAKIIIEMDDTYDPCASLRDIAAQIEVGFTSGEFPTWYILA